MRICFFNDAGFLGGGELWVLKASRHLLEMGHELLVVCPWRSQLQGRCLAEGINVWAHFHMEGMPFYEPLYERLKKFNADVVYCTVMGGAHETPLLETLVGRLNEDRPDHPIALILKTGLPPMSGMTPDHYGMGEGRETRRLHVVSEDSRRAFLEWQPELSPEFVQVMSEGVELGRFNGHAPKREDARESFGLPQDAAVVTCLSRLHSMKGQDNLLLAAAQFVDKRPDARLLLAGEGEDRERLERLRDTLGLQDRVDFLGHVDDIPALLSATDVVCHPSLADGMPNSVVEAMAAGVPVVASRVGGIPEVVSHEQTGLLVDPNDINGVASAVDRLLDSPDLRTSYGEAAKRTVADSFDLLRNVGRLVEAFEEEVHAARTKEKPKQPEATRCLFLMNYLRTGGEETELAILSKGLDRNRIRISVASLFPVAEACPAADRIRQAGIEIDEACHGFEEVSDKLGYLRDKIRRERIQVVTACQDTRFAYELFSHLSPLECRLVEHGGIVEEASAIPKDRTARYIGVSDAIRDRAAETMDRPESAVTIPSMVDLDAFDGFNRDDLRRGYGFREDTCVITFIGRLDAKKRVEDLMHAAARLLGEAPEALFLVVGGADAFQPEYPGQLMERCKPLTDTGRVLFLGDRSDVASLLTASDVLVLPSIGEGMSHVINEAGSAGLAVVASDDGAAREQLDDGRAGRLYPVGDVDQLTETLRRLVADPNLRSELGERLRQRVAERYSARRLLPIWESILTEEARALPPRHVGYLDGYDRALEFPLEIQIQTNTSCNASCIMCPYPEVSKEFEPGRMDESLYRDLLDECGTAEGLRRIEPFLMNDPFTDSRMPELIAEAKKRAPSSLVTLTTNGGPLAPKVIDRLNKSGLDAIWFSFNGANPDTYEKIMGVPYARVKSNIEYLLKTKPDSLQVFVNMIETEPMAAEIQENIRYWQSLGVQAGSSPLVNRGGNVKNFEELNYTAISDQPIRTCELPFYKMYVLYNGDAVLCCMDWRRSVVLGNVRRDGIRRVWNNPSYKEMRRRHTEGRDSEVSLCANCSYTLR